MLQTDRPQVAVVGAGYWGKNLVRDFYRLDALRLVVDQSPAVRAAVEKNCPGLPVSADLEAALADPLVTGLVVALPAARHYELTREALLRGKHVFVEKPLALSAAEGRELCRLARDQRLVLMVDHLLQRHPAVTALTRLIRAGELGRIRHIYSRRMNFGKVRREENVLWSLAPHDLAMILAFMGTGPEKVAAAGQRILRPNLEDLAEIDLFFPGGVQAHISVSWLNPVKEQKLVVLGDRKTAVFDDTLPWADKLKLYEHRVDLTGPGPAEIKGEAQAAPLEEAEPLKLQCLDFLSAMVSGQAPLTSGDEALKVLELLEAATLALQSGRPQALPARPGEVFVHPTAVVDDGAELGPGCKVWHFSHLMSGARLGPGCSLGQNVVVAAGVTIGRGCKIQNNVSIYEGVELADHVFCGPSMVFTNVINPRANVSRRHEFRKTRVGEGASIGANATIICGHDLGPYCLIGAGSVVTRNVPAHALMTGSPARVVGWVCRCGVRLNLDLQCRECGLTYKETPGGLAVK